MKTNTMTYFKYLNLLLVILLISCNPDENPGENTTADPANLTIVVDIADDDSGNVLVTATANNTTEYHFYMGEIAEADPFINDTGIYEYTYSALGTYQIEVRAYGSNGRFVKKTKQIAVQGDAAPTVGEGYTTPTQ